MQRSASGAITLDIDMTRRATGETGDCGIYFSRIGHARFLRRVGAGDSPCLPGETEQPDKCENQDLGDRSEAGGK